MPIPGAQYVYLDFVNDVGVHGLSWPITPAQRVAASASEDTRDAESEAEN